MDRNSNVTLTVTLPVHNGMPYLPAAVESVLRQSYDDFEFLIIDDGSTDGSAEFLRSLNDPRIKLTVRENRGLGATLNELFTNSRSDYVARMDADDICEPARFQSQMDLLRENHDVVMVGTGITFMAADRLIGGLPPLTEHAAIRDRLMQKRPGVNHPTIVVKRSAWSAVGGYRFSGAGEDLDFCLRLCDVGRATNIPQPLYRYRLGTHSLTFKKGAETNRGYAFAVACARAREQGVPEPDLDRFRQQWEQRSVTTRVADVLYTAGENLYRTSIIRRAEGRLLVSRTYLLAAAFCMPHVAWANLSRRDAKHRSTVRLQPLPKPGQAPSES